MPARILVKLGGSVITDKTGEQAPNMPVITRLAGEVRAALDQHPVSIVLGHGSGSFGHTVAARYGVHRGIAAGASWRGFAETSAAALRLNRILVDALLAAGVPAFSIQPSATLVSTGGTIVNWDTQQVRRALDHGLLPVIHGDVAFDTTQGSAIISTEQLLDTLARQDGLQPTRIVLVGEDAVYTADPHIDPAAQRIPLITADTIDSVLGGTGGSHATDVTGGMRAKLQQMWALIEALPALEVQLIGPSQGLLGRALLDQAAGEGTLMRRG